MKKEAHNQANCFIPEDMSISDDISTLKNKFDGGSDINSEG